MTRVHKRSKPAAGMAPHDGGRDSNATASSASSGSEDGAHPMDAYLAQRSGASHSSLPTPAPGQPRRNGAKQRAKSAAKLQAAKPGGGGVGEASPPESGELPDGGAAEEEEEEDFEEAIANGAPSPVVDDPASKLDSGMEDEDEGTAGAERRPSKKARTAAAAKPPPVGVIVLAEGEVAVRNAQVDRLLRQPRYFDEDYQEAGKRCFKCGALGHMARECTNPSRENPCFLCAEYGHESRACPNSLCWKCQRPGHVARDCPYGYSGVPAWEGWSADGSAHPVCMRCGRTSCPAAGQPDYVRAEGGCTKQYLKRDMRRVNCYVCGARGHLCCGEAAVPPARPSCFNCGSGGHVAAECTMATTPGVASERRGVQAQQAQQQQQHQRYSPAKQQYAGSERQGYDTPRAADHPQPRNRQYSAAGGGGGGWSEPPRYVPQHAAPQHGGSRFAGYSGYAKIEQPLPRGGGSGGARVAGGAYMEQYRAQVGYSDVPYDAAVRYGARYGATSYNGHQGRR